MKRILQYLFKGLAILLPIVVTFALLQWLLVTIETWLKPIWITLLGESSYFPGLAFISFLAIALLIGFSSRWRFIDSLWQLPGKLMKEDQVAVFLPMSYNVGGYMVIVPGDCVESLTMKPADALQLTISGGLGKNPSGKTD
ncbi:DUF502 domain-containing protein [Idiomarina aminovorans]|uniref:DUF502 domain-containing protein n=1 Tax=Idiomarina aminovorans TaxID=2914829 RepID=UPI002003F740|nr:hypothetical protein [Idiomarina sp. ATCH4]MCK7460516.1 hypothetical protein [Idiomarina sp. ATCH4]